MINALSMDGMFVFVIAFFVMVFFGYHIDDNQNAERRKREQKIRKR